MKLNQLTFLTIYAIRHILTLPRQKRKESISFVNNNESLSILEAAICFGYEDVIKCFVLLYFLCRLTSSFFLDDGSLEGLIRYLGCL